MRQAILATVLAGAAVLGGCEMRLDMPDNFVTVDEGSLGPYDVRGVSADGMVLAARREPNAENGTLAFWTEAVKRELAARNYTLGRSEEVESDGGLAGTLMTFSASRGGRPFTYMTAVFVTSSMFDDGEVFIAEAGGEESILTPRQDEIRKTLLTIRSAMW